MAGTINLALTQQFDMDGEPLGGGLLQTLIAGTTTPQPSFQDFGLTILHPNPIVLDASGRVPMFYLADGFIKIILKDKNGVVIIAADQMLVIGPSTGTSGGAGVDVTTVLQTGDIKCRYGENTHTGFVRCNGNTIGQTGSSATEVGGVGPQAQALYEYLWGFSNITLDSAVKGANAPADFGALKRLILPDLRGRVIAGLDDMGAAAANRLTSTYFGASGIVLGSSGGGQSHTLTAGQLAAHLHGLASQQFGLGALANVGNDSPDHSHHLAAWTSSNANTPDHTHGPADIVHFAGGAPVLGSGASFGSPSAGDSGTVVGGAGALAHSHGIPAVDTGGASDRHSHLLSGSTQATVGDGAHPNVQPTLVMTFYIKL
jgi:microcystin-dependent protein